MEKITVLGTAGAVVNSNRDNVSLVFSADNFHVLIECGGSAAHKLAKLGIAYEKLELIIITHIHLDHLYGLPGFIFSSIYRDLKRTAPLKIYCPAKSVDVIETLLDLFQLREKPSFPVEICGVPNLENAHVFENDRVVITATPVNHIPEEENIPTFGVKIFSKSSRKSVVYSSDTTYSERLIRLAKDAAILFHECSGLAKHPIPEWHSNALQVGAVAQKSEVNKLVLLHIETTLNDDPTSLIAEVRQHFEGEIVVASDFDEYWLD